MGNLWGGLSKTEEFRVAIDFCTIRYNTCLSNQETFIEECQTERRKEECRESSLMSDLHNHECTYTTPRCNDRRRQRERASVSELSKWAPDFPRSLSNTMELVWCVAGGAKQQQRLSSASSSHPKILDPFFLSFFFDDRETAFLSSFHSLFSSLSVVVMVHAYASLAA